MPIYLGLSSTHIMRPDVKTRSIIFRVSMTFCLVFHHAMTSCLLGEDKLNRPFKMDSGPVKRCVHKKEVLVFHDHGSGKWLFLKGSYYWREPFFTSMMMGERVII